MFALLLTAVFAVQDGYEPDNYGAQLRAPAEELHLGPWRAWLESPGDELPFGLEIAREGAKLSATIVNGEERILVPSTTTEDADLVLDMPHYDSTIRARISPYGTKLTGEWKKRSGPDRWTVMPFRAEAGEAPRFRPIEKVRVMTQAMQGRFAVKFEKSDDPAVAILRSGTGSSIEGTILTTTGDYRWLAGSMEGGRLRLSCFDGAHAFLVDASVDAQGVLRGRFWSGDRWQEGLEARWDPKASIPDGFESAHWKGGIGLAQLLYPDLDGRERCLGEPAFGGKAIVIQVLGSWCPNCHDEMAYLAKIYERYRERGLSVVGLAFELTGDFERDTAQVKRMVERHGVTYPVLLAGSSDKKKAAEAFPVLDRVFAFPTTIFLHEDGRVRAVHSGFSGPGTKEAHEVLTRRFESIIEELLAEPDEDDRATWFKLTAETWWDEHEGAELSFPRDGSQRRFTTTRRDNTHFSSFYTGVVEINGRTVLLDGTPWHFEPDAQALLAGHDFGYRLLRWERQHMPTIEGYTAKRIEEILDWMKSPDPLVRREAAYFMPAGSWFGRPDAKFDPGTLLHDPDVMVRCTAAAACSRLRWKDAGPRLVEMLGSGFASERREAARAIRSIGYTPGLEAVRSLRRDIDPLVRAAAAE